MKIILVITDYPNEKKKKRSHQNGYEVKELKTDMTNIARNRKELIEPAFQVTGFYPRSQTQTWNINPGLMLGPDSEESRVRGRPER